MPRGKDRLMVVLKGRLDIQDNPRFKKRVSNQVSSRFHKGRDYRVSNLKSNREGILVHQPRSQLVESVAISTMMIVLREQIIVLVVVKVGTRLGIALI